LRSTGHAATSRRPPDATMWDELLAAFGLMLVLEGILPFLNPNALRQSLMRMAQLEDRTLRFVGLGSMLLGLLVLYFFR
jgi:uncharacterized protein YjeT (DUF2065 family)